MKPVALKKRRIYFYILLAVFIAVIPIIILHSSGYRIDKENNLIKTGGIYIYSLEKGSKIYINNEKKRETNIFQRNLFVQNLKPDIYTILILKKGFWPLNKEVKVFEKKVSEVMAFLVPKEPKKEEVLKVITINTTNTDGGVATGTAKINKKYKKIINLFATGTSTQNVIDTVDTTDYSADAKISNRNNSILWRYENSIFITWIKNVYSIPNYFCRNEKCKKTILVFKSTSPINSYDFYPGREDVVLVSMDNDIYAIDIDNRKQRNLQSIYSGINPYFVVNEGQLYVKDDNTLFKIDI